MWGNNMAYYDDCRKCAMDLSRWIDNPKRSSWTMFCSLIRRRYGFSPRRMMNVLKEDYPDFRIKNDLLINASEEYINDG